MSNESSGGIKNAIIEKMKDIAWNFSAKDTAPSMSLNKRILIGVVIGVVLVGAIWIRSQDSSPVQDDSTDKTHASNQDSAIIQYSEEVLGVRSGTNNMIGDEITYGEAFDHYFLEPEWSSFQAETGESVVEFSGVCTYIDDEFGVETNMDVYVQFLLHEDDVFELYHLSFNDVAQADITKIAFIEEVFETYAEDHGISLDQSDAAEQTTEQAPAQTTEKTTASAVKGMDKYLGDWDVPDINAWFTLRKDGNGYYFHTFGNVFGGGNRSNLFIDEGYDLYDERVYLREEIIDDLKVWEADFIDAWDNIGTIWLYEWDGELHINVMTNFEGVEYSGLDTQGSVCFPA